MNQDPRVAELEQLAKEEGIKLPYPIDYIIFLEDHGHIVNLVTGFVHDDATVGMPTASAKAILHLLGSESDVIPEPKHRGPNLLRVTR